MYMAFCIYCEIETPHIYERKVERRDPVYTGLYSCYVCGQYCHGICRDRPAEPIKPGDLEF